MGAVRHPRFDARTGRQVRGLRRLKKKALKSRWAFNISRIRWGAPQRYRSGSLRLKAWCSRPFWAGERGFDVIQRVDAELPGFGFYHATASRLLSSI